MTASLFKSQDFLNFDDNAVLWIISIFSQLSIFSSPFFPLSGTVPGTLSAIGITFTLILHKILLFSGKIQVFVYLFALYSFLFVVNWNNKIHKTANYVSFFSFY